MRRTGVGTLVVVDESRRLVGLLTARDLRFVAPTGTVTERMTPRDGSSCAKDPSTSRPPKR